ncbi:MAG: D-alanyl-D-alanine carboxypeptidase, partial [Clostridia bacterium]|nr:D-alanyl-D-alanine carboxypeptidase [Clostridia bacterium]
ASITKIMSLLLVMEAIDNKTLSLEDVLTCSDHAASMGGSQIWLEPGESMTVDDLLKATVIASANDATVMLGEAIAGSEEGFVSLMNEKAKKLGMNNTNFINCTGLDAEGHYSTAHDVAIMSCELIKHELIKQYTTVWMDSLRGGESELVNTNKLVRFYEGTTGLKTGTTSTAGYCLSASAMRDGTELVAVVMGSESSNDRFESAKKLLNYGFANFALTEIHPEKTDAFSVEIDDGEKKKFAALADGFLKLLLKKNEGGEIKQEINLKEDIKAPVRQGDKVGSIDVFLGEELIGSIDITAAENVGKMNYLTALKWLLSGLLTL